MLFVFEIEVLARMRTCLHARIINEAEPTAAVALRGAKRTD
jgi:hypothetical protein